MQQQPPQPTDAMEPRGGSCHDDGTGGEPHGDGSRSRYDAIRIELRFLSDLHRMRERGGFDDAKAGGENAAATTARRGGGSGRTRTLKARHLNDFSDDDYPAYTKGDSDLYPGDAADPTFRRFRIFNRFARSTCHARAIARKEIFEAWAMALYVHETFLSNRALSLSLPAPPGRKRRRPVKRFADLACSHGLLSWALLLLASSEEEEESERLLRQQQQRPRHEGDGAGSASPRKLMSAVCIDVAMPKSSETLSKIFFKEYPQFLDDGSASSSSSSSNSPSSSSSASPIPVTGASANTITDEEVRSPTARSETQRYHPRWDYVEGPVENLVSHESTLLMGIHACGRLSDTIIDQAIDSNAPLALVPCCHSKKILTASQVRGFAALQASWSLSNSNDTVCHPVAPPMRSYTLADFMDSMRKERLVEAGYAVEEFLIPEEFTPMNRILLAVPPAVPSGEPHPSPFSKPKKKSFGIPYFAIPLEDAPSAKVALRSLAGRAPADRRKDAANPPPAICVSVWLPTPSTASGGDDEEEEKKNDDDDGTASADRESRPTPAASAGVFTVEALQKVLDEAAAAPSSAAKGSPGSTVRVVEAEHKPYVDPNDSSRRSTTFRVHYLDCRNNKAEARKRHKRLKEVLIPRHFPAYPVRG